jgi:hypothetical protein
LTILQLDDLNVVYLVAFPKEESAGRPFLSHIIEQKNSSHVGVNGELPHPKQLRTRYVSLHKNLYRHRSRVWQDEFGSRATFPEKEKHLLEPEVRSVQ